MTMPGGLGQELAEEESTSPGYGCGPLPRQSWTGARLGERLLYERIFPTVSNAVDARDERGSRERERDS